VAAFRDFLAQTITRYAANGSTVISGPKIFSHQIDASDGDLRVPYSLGWDLQVDRELRRNMVLRLGYEQREVFRDFCPIYNVLPKHLDPQPRGILSSGISQATQLSERIGLKFFACRGFYDPVVRLSILPVSLTWTHQYSAHRESFEKRT
jgi:hypothetical protein